MQVVIVGAGPAGLATAYLLAQRHVAVTLVERETALDRLFRGEGLMPSGIEALQMMGLQPVLDETPHRILDAWDFCIDGQRRMRVWEPQQKLGDLTPRIFSPSALLQGILAKAQALPEFTWLPGCQVQQLQWEGQRVTGVQVRDREGLRNLAADLVIAADGRHSRLRKLAGLALTPASTQFDVLWFKLPAPQEILVETVFTVCLQRSRQFAFYPSWDERLQLGWIVPKGRASQLANNDWIAAFAPALPRLLVPHFRQQQGALEGPIFLDVIVGCCPQWWIPGLLLIGDAAHPMAPNRAQGINMALRDAIAVTNHLVPCDRPSLDPTQLATVLARIQATRQPEIHATQHLQLEEWQKIGLLTASPFTYYPFTVAATLFGRSPLIQAAWLRQQQGLRHGTTAIALQV